MTENWRCDHGKAADDWCSECNAPLVDDIWKEVDPRMVRFVKVMRVGKSEAEIRKCEENGDIPKRSIKRQAQLARFNGNRGGYQLHRRLPSTSGVDK